MLTPVRSFAGWLGTCVFGAAISIASSAGAQVFQTDAAKTPLPQPVGTAELNLVTQSWGWNTLTQSYKDPASAPPGTQLPQCGPGVAAPCAPIVFGQYYAPPTFPQFADGDAITLQGLFKWRGEKLDWRADAKTAPGYFSPACGFSGQLLLLGGNCQISFGWYNVEDPNSTTPPAPGDIHEFVPKDPTYLNCLDENGNPKTDGFCPKAWDNRSPRNLSILEWTPKAFDSGNIKNDPNYKGKYVGFAVIGNTDPKFACSQTKYSMYNYNQKNSSGVPWVTTLIYQSTVDPEGFYMAFEDLPMSAADWHQTGVPGNMATNDGDFNDFVFYVSGISCEGGNEPCDTKLQGACSVGHTDCKIGDAAPACRPVVQPGPEICDNVDNDCDGVIDNGTSLCPDPSKPICFQGTCVGNCNRGEFPCPDNTTCDASGHCVDPTCAAVTCNPGTACRSGKCVDPCTGVVCPYGSQCELGQCVDPCAGVTCTGGRVCDKGLCVADCSCRPCDAGLTCGKDGKCTDTACATVNCPTGQVCRTGSCIDPCAGVVCPNQGVCSMGVCTAGNGMSTGGASSDPGISFGADSPGLNFGGGGTTSTSSEPTHGLNTGVASKGCSCRLVEESNDRSNTLTWLSVALGLGMTSWVRRRRSLSVN